MLTKIKKPVSILLSLIMVFSLFTIVPMTAYAATATYTGLMNNRTVVKFNNYNWYIMADDSTTTGGTVTLLAADTSFGIMPFRADDTTHSYNSSDVKAYLDSIVAGTAGAGKPNFKNVADVIEPVNLTTPSSWTQSLPTEYTTGAKLWLLSVDEVGSYSDLTFDGAQNNGWWLRNHSSNDPKLRAAYVRPGSGVSAVGTYVTTGFGVRPALKLNLSKVTFDSTSKTFSPHTHSFSYSASGATITRVCQNAGCSITPPTLTLVAPAKTSNTDSKSAEATLTGLAAFNTATGLNVSVGNIKYYLGTDELQRAPSDPGSYTAKITVGGATATVSYTITDNSQADPPVIPEFPQVSGSYNNSIVYESFENGIGSWSSNSGWQQQSGGAYSGSNYCLYHTWGSSSSYNNYDIDKTFDTSGYTDLTLSFYYKNRYYSSSYKDDLYVYYYYNGEWHEALITSSEHSSWTYFSCSIPDGTSGLRFRIHTKYGSGVYVDDVRISGDLSSYGFQTSSNPVAVQNLVYNGSQQQLVEGGSDTYYTKAGNTVSYHFNSDVTSTSTPTSDYEITSSANVKATNAGTYKVYWIWDSDATYSDAYNNGSVTVVIDKATPVVTAPTANDLTYNKADQALVTAGSTTGGTLLYSLDGITYSANVPQATNAGTYTVYYKVQGNANYYDVAPQTVEVEIKKATPVATIKTKDLYFNNWQDLIQSDALTITGAAGDVDISDEAKLLYSLEGGLNELDYSPVGKKVGAYDCYYRIEALSDNVNAVDYAADQFATVNIYAVPTVTMTDYTYNTTLPTLAVEGNMGNGTVTYYYYPADGDAADAVVWDDSTTELTLDAGDYKMYAVIAESDTALGVTTEAVDFTVEVKTVDAPTIIYSPADNTYNGSEITPAVTVKDGDVVIDPSEYTVTYSENINAGTATITITDAEGGSYTVSGTKTFVIKKAPINPTVTVAGWTYNGEAPDEPAVVTGNTGNGAETITYKVKNASDDTYTAEVPVNAGTYTVKLVIAETDNYLGKTVTSDFTIAKAPITPTVTINNWIYSATPDEPQVTGNPGNGDVTYTYAVKDSDEFTADVPTDAGDYTVKAVIAETANYKGAEATADFTIAKADITPTVTIEGWTFGEEANEPEITGNTGNGEVTILYKHAGDTGLAFTDEVPANAGDYVVKAIIAETANYKGGVATADFTIAKADITPTVTIEGWTYGDEANEPVVTGNTENGEVTITYAVKDSDEFTADVPENAGEYTVKAVIADTANYKGAEATADFTIAKADITPTVTIEGWTYGEDANEPEVTGNTGNGEVTYTYAVKDSEEFTSDVPANAGDYTVKAVIAATDNYLGKTVTSDFTIAKAPITPTVTINNWIYSATPDEPQVTGNPGNGDVTYLYKKQGDTDLAYTADVPVNAGDYTVKAIVATTTNYLSGSATADFTIEKKDPEMGEGKDFNIVALELVYNDLLQNLITEYVKEGSGLVVRYSFYPEGMNPQVAGNIPRAKAIGEYKIYYMVEGNDNYNSVPWLEAPLTATIEQETFEVTIEGWAYGEDANDPVAEANFTDYTEFTYTYAVKGSEEFTAEVPENVGEYTVKASITSDNAYYSTLTATADFTIVKADITPAVTLEGWTYGEEANEPEVTGNTGEGGVTITYAVKDSDEFTADVPTEAGDYTVKAVIAETDSYNGAEATADFTIAKADFEPTVTIEGWTYGEDANEPEVTGNTSGGEVTITYAVKDSYEFTADVPENAGDYTVKAVIAETDNYNSAEATADFTIAKADITPNVTVEGWTYGEYDETVNGPSVSGNTENGDVTYLYKVKDADDETYTDERPENAGDYTVKAVVAETADYNGAEATADFTITKAAIDPEIILDGWAYSDEANDPSINEGGNPGNGDVEYTYTFKGSDAYSARKPVYPGTYNVKAVVAETDNYLGTTVYKDFAIKKGTFEPTVTLEGWLYGEETNEPELTGNISEGAVKFTYAPEGSDAFSATVPTTPGSYVVKATIASTDLYDAVEVTAAFEIGQSYFTITWKNDDGTVIDTTSVAYGETPTHADAAKDATDQYTYTFAGWTPEIVAATADAEYTATYTATSEPVDRYFSGHSLTLAGDIGINFYVTFTDAQLPHGAVVDFIWTVEGVEKTASVTLTAKDLTANGYKATCPVAVAEMTCDVNATLTIGGVLYDTDTYTVKQYANTILSDDYKAKYLATNHTEAEYDKLANLVKAMLVYGGKAQIEFNRNTGNLANAGLDYTMAAVTADMIPSTASDMESGLDDYGLAYAGTTIVYLSKTSMRHYYTITDQAKFDAVKDSITFDGVKVDPVEKNGKIYFETINIAAADLDTPYTLTIGTNDYNYAVLDYVRACLSAPNAPYNTKQLVTATYWYNQAANAYFGR